MSIPAEKQPFVLVWEGENYTIGEFNVLYHQGKTKVSAADEYTILNADSSFLLTDNGPRLASQGEVFRWSVGNATYEYTVISKLLIEVGGWLMRRTDTMPRTEPRMWHQDGDELPRAMVTLEELAAANAEQTREAAGAAGTPWKQSSRHPDAEGVAYPRIPFSAVPDHQALLIFRSQAERDAFTRWLDGAGWDAFRSMREER